MGAVAPIGFRINPDVAAGTHAKITTGTADNKFGIAATQALDAYRAVQPKELMVKAQEARIAGVVQRIRAAATARNAAEIKRLQHLQEHEQKADQKEAASA